MNKSRGNNATIAYFFDPKRKSSGARFFRELCKQLASVATPYHKNPDVVLFNMSSPLSEIIKCKIQRKRIVLRVDGLWFDRLSREFLSNLNPCLRSFILVLQKISVTKKIAADVANLCSDNYKSFIKIFFSDYLIFQSEFSKDLHKKYFPQKKSVVILNAAKIKLPLKKPIYKKNNEIKICVIYSEAAFKGIYESIDFVSWLNLQKGIASKLFLLGFNGKLPFNAPKDMKTKIMNSKFIVWTPEFRRFGEKLVSTISACHFYLCLSRRDPCPNAVIECMAHGLPVLGIKSGGLPEIVGDAGELIDWDDWSDGLFHPQRFEFVYHQYDFEALCASMHLILNNLKYYQKKVEKRFRQNLGLKTTAKLYKIFLQKIAQKCLTKRFRCRQGLFRPNAKKLY